MHKIDGAGHVDGQFVTEDAANGRPPTLVTADWLNAVQSELVAVLQAAGIAPDKANNAQLSAAIGVLLQRHKQESDPHPGYLRGADFEEWKADWLNSQPMPINEVANPLLTGDAEGAAPLGYSGVGLDVVAVSPLTKGFQGPYWNQSTIDAEVAAGRTASRPEDATATRPYPFGVYNLGPRWAFWGGGLGQGWGSAHGGKIIRVSGAAGTQKALHIAKSRVSYASAVRLQCWMYLAAGSVVHFGNHAGYTELNEPNPVRRHQFGSAADGWLHVDITISGIGSTVNLNYGWGCSIGFRQGDVVEAYIAIPYIYSFQANEGGFSG